MKKILRKLGGLLAVGWFIALFVVSFIAYFITKSSDGVLVDGLGRPLSEAPLMMRLMFGQERLWAGWSWFLIDMAVYFGSIVVVAIGSYLLEDKDEGR